MEQLLPVVDQIRNYIGIEVPVVSDNAVLSAIAVLLLGVGISVFGAKLAKPGIIMLLSAAGGMIGVIFGREAGVQPAVCGLVSSAMFATVGFLTFRLWVGVLTAVVATMVVLGGLGYQRVAPHVGEFQTQVQAEAPYIAAQQVSDSANATATNGSLGLDPTQWVQRFWLFVTQRDAGIQVTAKLIALAAMTIGLFVGVVAVRWMLILSTSIAGTMLVATGVTAILSQLMVGAYQSLLSKPAMLGMGAGGFLVSSLIMQTLLTRKAPEAEDKKA